MSLTPEQQKERLQVAATTGALIRAWCQHDGYKIFKQHFETKIDQARETWLTEENPTKADALKRKAILWNEIVGELKKFMLVGDNALHVIQDEFHDEAPGKQDSPQ